MSDSTLANLPDVHFADRDPAIIEAQVISLYQILAGRYLAPADPVRIFLLALVAVVVQQRAIIDASARGELLAYATGDVLDHLAAFYNVTRKPATAASTTVRFSIASALAFDVLIPAGTRVTADSSLMWATSSAKTIPAGSTYVDATCVCSETGVIGNSLVAGQINILVDPLGYVVSVANTTITTGGADIESDDELRERVQLAPESFSVAGPRDAYKFFALSARSDILDVAVLSPTPCVVHVLPLMEGGVLPTQTALDAIAAVCNADTVRPLTDQVTVMSPTAVNFTLALTYTINVNDSGSSSTIQAAVATAVATWVLWQKSKLGRDINKSELTRLVKEAGVQDITALTLSVSDMTINEDQVAICTSNTITFGGLVNG